VTIPRGLALGRLCELAGVDRASQSSEGLATTVAGVTHDSRRVSAGDLFVAISGEQHDGAVFAPDAIASGAGAVVSESTAPADCTVPWIQVADARVALAHLAASLQGDPSHELMVVGVTGTNGKTTTTYLIEAMLEHAGMRCGRMGSITYRVGDKEHVAPHTTPEASELQVMLRAMVDAGSQACVLEVSSHALALHRTDRIRFAAGVFSNLTRDHLDFHGDMSRYFAAKKRLFDGLDETAPAVVNVDDEYGRQLASQVKRPMTYRLDGPADIRPDRVRLTADGIELDTITPRGRLHLRSPLLGRANAYNLLAAAATGAALSLPFESIEDGLASVDRVPGRMDVVSQLGDDVTVLVDFAHTDDALKGLLAAARPLTRSRLVTVFGCGGDRDRTKRPLMGTVASRLSDQVIVTSDNPRSEDAADIAQDIEAGLRGGEAEWSTVLDREEAITRAIREAHAGDLVVVAGKGHEQHQVTGSRVVPFDDARVARQALAGRRSASRVG
jgi:UDP-N-acetylmuramoyl-L-alanyl-D-glutamate--2,6-diaminopimelate ligase